MSILLDALRKSERQQRLGAVPNIHSADSGTGSTRRGTRWQRVVLALVLALLFAAVLVWRAGYLPGDRTTDTTAVDPMPATEAPARAFAPAFAPAGPAQGLGMTPKPAAGQDASPAGSESTQTPQSPVATLNNARSFQPAERSAEQDRRRATPRATSTQQVPDPVVDTGASPLTLLSGQSPDAFGAEAPAEPAVPDPDPAPAREPARSAPPSESNGLISYWQLPEFTRKQLPPFKINVLVFDDDPERRFVLMDGQRLQIGDNPIKSLRVLNIERDRVVFRYGVYRFYVRQGS